MKGWRIILSWDTRNISPVTFQDVQQHYKLTPAQYTYWLTAINPDDPNDDDWVANVSDIPALIAEFHNLVDGVIAWKKRQRRR